MFLSSDLLKDIAPGILSRSWLITLDNFNIYVDGLKMMGLLSFLIFLFPMILSCTLFCPSFPIIIIRPCRYKKNHTPFLIAISRIILSLFYYNEHFSFLWGMRIGGWSLAHSFLYPKSGNHYTHQGLNPLILLLYTFSYMTYIFTPWFSLLKFPHQLLLLSCIQN